MLINSDDIKIAKEHIEVMQAFIDGKEIEFKQDSYKGIWKDCTTPIWNFPEYNYRIKPSDKKKFTNPLHSHSDSFWENSKPIEKTHNVPFFHSIMADQFVELGIELPDYMVKQLSPEKLDYLTKKAERLRKETGYPKFDESILEETKSKPSEPEYVYPIYKRLKKRPETIIKFTSINAGIYISTHKNSIYKKYEKATALTPHTEEDWEDCNASINENTIELFEVIYYCDILKEFEFVKQLYLDEDLINKRHLYKTGRSFIIDKETRQLIKVVNQ